MITYIKGLTTITTNLSLFMRMVLNWNKVKLFTVNLVTRKILKHSLIIIGA